MPRFEKGKTKFMHHTFGEGTFIDYKNDNLVIDFGEKGVKIISPNILNTTVLQCVNEKISEIRIETGNKIGDTIQFDTSSIRIKNENIAESVENDNDIIFNESYTVIGNSLKGKNIYACYDLIVEGNINAESLEVNGKLVVIGNINAKSIMCSRSLLCEGEVAAGSILVGGDFFADNIACDTLECTGKVFVNNTLDCNSDVKVNEVIFAGEGIIGTGNFKSKGAVAAEYFEFEGNVQSKIMELETLNFYNQDYSDVDKTNTDTTKNNESVSREFIEIEHELMEVSSEMLNKAGNIDEDELMKCIEKISRVNDKEVSSWKMLTEYVINMSYLEEIANLKDFLILFMADKTLPKEVKSYETLEHVFRILYQDSKDKYKEMEYNAENIFELGLSIYIICKYNNEFENDFEDILDKIFQSIGIKYNTVKNFFK